MDKTNLPTLSVQVYDTLPSTNDMLQALADADAPSGTLVIARHQTAGRGRMGRRFHSPAGTGLYMSLLLRPHLSPDETLLLTPMAAVAAAEGIAAVTGIQTGIKWVNDLFLDGKKVCGILAQAKFHASGNAPAYAIIGAGINLAPPKGGFPEDIAEIAGALYPAAEQMPDGLALTLAKEIAGRMLAMSENIAERGFYESYRARLCVLGETVVVAEQEQESPAKVLDLDRDFRLLVEYPDGRTAWRSTGEIRVRFA